MLLAGDIGGTASRMGVFQIGRERPHATFLRTYATRTHDSAHALVTAFLDDAHLAPTEIEAVCFGVAGPVVDGCAQLTNIPWRIDAAALAPVFGSAPVTLVNDLYAMAAALPALRPEELHTLHAGHPRRHGPMAVLAAGTGLGEAVTYYASGRWHPAASEAGHADFAPRTDDDVRLWRSLRERFGRAAVEHVVSGPGLASIHAFVHATPCQAFDASRAQDVSAEMTSAALDGRCAQCTLGLNLFVESYGAEAGNLALRALPTGGLFVGGGIAPKILPAITNGQFMRAFFDKAPMTSLLESIPVHVILHPYVGLFGAAICAASH